MAKDNSKSLTLTTDDGEEILVVVIPFEPVEAYEIIAKMEKMGGGVLSAFRKEILSNTYVVRKDAKGESIRIELSGPNADKAMNRAFRGTGIVGLGRALKFAQEVNFADFFAAARQDKKAADDAKKLLADRDEATTEESDSD